MPKRPYRRQRLISTEGGAERLSRRETDVLRLLAAGRTNQEIARVLVIAESTVKMHLKHLYSKLNVHNRVQATILAHHLHLLLCAIAFWKATMKRIPHMLVALLGLLMLIFSGVFATQPTAAAQSNQRCFPETGQCISGRFYEFWQDGGLSIFGYPISPARYELDPDTGKALFVQWFERARFEQHPEWAGGPHEIQLSLLGRQFTQEQQHQPEFQPIAPFPSTAETRFFPETGHSLSVGFKQFWEQNGGVAIFGYPISEAFPAQSPINGQWYSVQYFERARFEYHPYNAPEYQVELGLLGRQLIQAARPVAPEPHQTVKVYLIDPSVPFDATRGTGLVPIEVQITPTKRVLRAAIEALLSLPKGKRADGLINALADSQLRVDDVTLVAGKATISLSGQLNLAGVGAEAYAKAQFQATARQFPTVKQAAVLVNGCPLPIGESGSGCTNGS
jgi:DNA-binding CsgD family transcriptional regulator